MRRLAIVLMIVGVLILAAIALIEGGHVPVDNGASLW